MTPANLTLPQARGRAFLAAALLVLATMILASSFRSWSEGEADWAGSLMSNALVLLILVLAFRGGQLTMKLTRGCVMLLAVVAALALFAIFAALILGNLLAGPRIPEMASEFVAFVLGAAFCFWSLFISTDVKAFIAYQRDRASPERHPNGRVKTLLYLVTVFAVSAHAAEEDFVAGTVDVREEVQVEVKCLNPSWSGLVQQLLPAAEDKITREVLFTHFIRDANAHGDPDCPRPHLPAIFRAEPLQHGGYGVDTPAIYANMHEDWVRTWTTFGDVLDTCPGVIRAFDEEGESEECGYWFNSFMIGRGEEEMEVFLIRSRVRQTAPTASSGSRISRYGKERCNRAKRQHRSPPPRTLHRTAFAEHETRTSMKSVISAEGFLLVACFAGASAIAIKSGNPRKATLLLYGFLMVWFVTFHLAIPGFRVYWLDDGSWGSFADSPAPLLFMALAAVHCLLFYIACLIIRGSYRYFTSRRTT